MPSTNEPSALSGFNDPETLTRIAQYEMAFRMQVSVPEVMNINNEPEYIHQLYGTTPGKASLPIIVYWPENWWNREFVLFNFSIGDGIRMEHSRTVLSISG